MIDSSQFQLLLVFSEPVLRELVSFRLELLGFQVESVEDGSQAAGSISRQRPDLVIVDTVLRDGDALEWISRIRTEHTSDELPIIIFSLDPSLETVERAYHAGAQDYLITPFDPTVMEEKIESILMQHGATAKARS